jgi:hypothetical protein
MLAENVHVNVYEASAARGFILAGFGVLTAVMPEDGLTFITDG